MTRATKLTFKTLVEKEEMIAYARAKGFVNLGAFALFAMNQYKTRNPVRKRRDGAVTCVTGQSKSDQNSIDMLFGQIKDILNRLAELESANPYI